MQRATSTSPLCVLASLALAGAALAVPSAAQCGSGAVQTLTASNGVSFDNFGSALDIDGNTLVTGARGFDITDALVGRAYVFERTAGVWSETMELVAADTKSDDDYGCAVALSGDVIAVGAPKHDTLPNAGAVYVFRRAAGVWTQIAKLRAADAVADDRFGIAVDIAGDTIAIGAARSGGAGAVYVFESTSGGPFTQVARLTATDAAAGDRFGAALSLAGPDALLIGAESDDNQGAAYVFERTPGGAFAQTAKLTAGDPAPGDEFGRAVSLTADRALIGAQNDDDQGGNSGSAYVFERTQPGSSSFLQVAKLLASDGAGSNNFGASVALVGGRALVGAERDSSGQFFRGSAYVFEASPAGFAEVQKLEPQDTSSFQNFGFAVALSNDTALVGAPFADPVGINVGTVTSFELASSQPLVGCPTEISLAAGGTQTFTLQAGNAFAGAVYLLLGSISGTAPGVPIGSARLPLNPDAYFSFTLVSPNAPPLSSSLATLDAGGQATAQFSLPAGTNPALIGTQVHHAYVVLTFIVVPSIGLISNASVLDLLP